MEYNIYCDESCHLENDREKAMVLGAVWCPRDKRESISSRIREIKSKHGFKTGYTGFEVKWVKVSPAKLYFYEDLINYYFDNDDLHFRAVVIPDKSQLRHNDFNQTHDDWYYKMYFNLLKNILQPNHKFFIYLDIKDTKSTKKIEILKDILRHSKYDYDHKIIRRVQHIRSHESEIMQLADLLIGAVSYVNRGMRGSSAKIALVNLIQEKSGYSLTEKTLPSEQKLNIFIWEPSNVGNAE